MADRPTPTKAIKAAAKEAKFGQKEEKLFEKGGKYLTEKRREEVPSSYFLDQENRKYPWKTPDGKANEKLLRAAYRRASQYHQPGIAALAKRKLAQYFNVHLGED